MNDLQISEEIKNLFIEDLLKDNFRYPEHKFSLRYRIKKNKVIRKYKREYLPKNTKETAGFPETKVKIPLKYTLKYILIIIILMAIVGFTIYRYYSGIFVREYDIFSMLSVEYDENSPQVLTERFYIDIDLSKYEKEILEDNEFIYWIQYKDGKTEFDVMQTILEVSSNVRLNTENAMIMPTNVVVNDWIGMYYQAYNESYIYFFNCGDYIISYAGNLDKNEMEKIVKATKFI